MNYINIWKGEVFKEYDSNHYHEILDKSSTRYRVRYFGYFAQMEFFQIKFGVNFSGDVSDEYIK